MQIIDGKLDDPRVMELLRIHLTTARAELAPNSFHALDVSGLRSPDITFWTVWDGDTLLGCGALRRLSTDHGDVKSMHTAEAARRRGVGAAMLNHIMDTARARGMTRLSLESGVSEYFYPAHTLYRNFGFTDCGPYGPYVADENSVFMSRSLVD